MSRWMPLLALFAVVGCGSTPVDVDYDYDLSTNFSKYKSWAWLPGSQLAEKDLDSLSEKRLRAAIEAELPRRGLAKAEEGADLHVTFKISIQHKIEESPVSVGVGYSWGPAHVGVSKRPTRRYDEGTLVLDLVDAKTKTLVWRGIAVGTVDKNANAEERRDRIQAAVAQLLQEYPPK